MRRSRRLTTTLLVLALSGGAASLGASTDHARELLPGPSASEAEAATTAACRRVKRVVRVRINSRRWPRAARHIRQVHRLKRWPRVWHIERDHAERRREASLRGIPTKPGYDRDELPPAMSRQGGVWRGRRAHVRYVPSGENRSAGAYMGNRLEPYCDGQRFVLIGR